jgi:hypothetical protein
LRQAVDGVVALAHRTDEAAEGVDVVLAGDGAAVLVDLGDRNLYGAVVLGLDDAVGSAALARDIAGKGSDGSVLLWFSGAPHLDKISGSSLQVHNLATVVLHLDGFERFRCCLSD